MLEKKPDLNTFRSTNYIIKILNKKGVTDLTNLKLQKLLYCAYGVHLVLFSEKLFNDQIQAWKLGPVVPIIYQEFKDCGKKTIGPNSLAGILRDDFSGEIDFPIFDEIIEINRTKSLFIACHLYGDKTAWELVEMLHSKGGGWHKNYDIKSLGIEIPSDDILQEFEGSMDKIATLILG
jgi:uncharacterized phage-associated protein